MATRQRSNTGHDQHTVEKAFVNEDGRTTLVCPNCSSVKQVGTDQYRDRQHRLKVKCSCGQVFTVNLDFRQCFRKATSLTGIFNLSPPATGGGMVDILNLSLTGIAFRVKGLQKIAPGNRGKIDFTLDNRRRTRLVRQFVVRSVRDSVIGCEFRKDQSFEKELGFYLRFGP